METQAHAVETQAQAEARDKARAYLRTKGTETPARLVAERVRAATAALDAYFASAPGDRVGVRTLDGEWSLQEIADHVLETHRPSLDELRCLLAGRRPPGGPIPAGLQSKAPRLRPWPTLLRELRGVHEDLAATLAAVPPEFATEARAPVVMVINVAGPDGTAVPHEWVEELDWKAYSIVLRLHAVDHLHQAKKVLAATTSPA